MLANAEAHAGVIHVINKYSPLFGNIVTVKSVKLKVHKTKEEETRNKVSIP
jgi:hypothetical protein